MGFCCDKIPGRVKTLPYSGFYRIDKSEFAFPSKQKRHPGRGVFAKKKAAVVKTTAAVIF